MLAKVWARLICNLCMYAGQEVKYAPKKCTNLKFVIKSIHLTEATEVIYETVSICKGTQSKAVLLRNNIPLALSSSQSFRKRK